MPGLKDDFYMWSLGHVLFNPATNEITVPNVQGNADLDNPVITKDRATVDKKSIVKKSEGKE